MLLLVACARRDPTPVTETTHSAAEGSETREVSGRSADAKQLRPPAPKQLADNLGAGAAIFPGWSEVHAEGTRVLYEEYSTDSKLVPPGSEKARKLICEGPLNAEPSRRRDLCQGEPPWVVTFAHRDYWGYRVVAPRPDGKLSMGPMLWERWGKVACEFFEIPRIDKVENELLLNIEWDGEDQIEACEPAGCNRDQDDCSCETECGPTRRGLCSIVLDPSTLAERGRRGDCAGPALKGAFPARGVSRLDQPDQPSSR